MQDVDSFDATFFQLQGAQMDALDLTERVLAEVMMEATIDAGYEPRDPRLVHAAVFTSVSSAEFSNHGSWECMTPRTIANLLGTNGSVENINTICSRCILPSTLH